MKLIVGLGNPGQKYARNRHNIGFMAVDRIAADHGFPPWRARFQGLVTDGRIGSARVTLLKPQGFMNLSGQSVGEAARYLKIAPADVIVFHDELDLAPGKLRCKSGGGHAGHNGLRSIHQHLGDGYDRVRLGIGHPGHKDRVTAHVLSDFGKSDEDWLEDLLRGISDGAAALAGGDVAGFQNAVALRRAPPQGGTGGTAGAVPAKTGQALPDPPQTGAGRPADGKAAAGPRSVADRLRELADRFR